MFILYNILLTLGSLIWVPWMLIRTAKRKEAPNWTERQGDYNISPRKDRKRIWIHAVSVGEVIAAMPVLRELKGRLPDHEIVLTTTTSTGHKTAREQAAGLYDHLFYFPIDVARFQLAAMQRVQPSVVAIMETELWMNFLWAAKVFDAHTLLINGRISDRSFKRSQLFKPFFKALLKNVDGCLMQTEADAQRIQALGAKTTEVLGNTKFDQALPQPDATDWRNELKLPKDKPLVVVGSTRGDYEEDFVIEALTELSLDRVAVVHAPRHIEGADALVEEYKDHNIQVGQRSRGTGGQVVVLDTYGELEKVYGVADVVVIGGGFDKLGGQNLIQALARGKPVLHGPYMTNFREVTRAADEAGAAMVVSTPPELARTLTDLLEDEDKRREMGQAAVEVVKANVGAASRYADVIVQAATTNSPEPRP